jgi:hypothetical protein
VTEIKNFLKEFNNRIKMTEIPLDRTKLNIVQLSQAWWNIPVIKHWEG